MNNDISWDTIRTARNFFLKQSDWTQLSDVEINEDEKNEWSDYRKQLRDITKNFRVPSEVVWPISPEIKKINEQ
jgi:hypothetical protein